MPYAPNVQDRSGEILGQGINSTVAQFARDMDEMRENERKRRTAAGQVQGILAANPQLAQKVDPTLLGKMSSGKAKLNDTLELLGTLSTVAQQEQEQQQRLLRQAQIQAAMAQTAAHTQQQQEMARRIQQEQALNAQMDQMMSRANTRGVLTADEQAAVEQLAQSPAARLRKQGVALTPEMMVELTKAEIANAPRPGKPMPGSGGYGRVEVPGLGTMIIDRATGEPIESGKIVRPNEKKNDEKSLTAGEIQQLGSLQQAARDIDMLEQRFGSYKDPNWGGPVAGRIKSVVGMGTNPRISEIENLVTSATPNLARGVFREVGVLTDADVERYRKLLPNVTDTAEQRAQKLKDLRSRLGVTLDETLSTLQAAGRDVTGLREKVIADKAAGKSGNTPSAAPKPGSKFPEFASPAEVEAALANGELQRGVVVRINGQLFRAE